MELVLVLSSMVQLIYADFFFLKILNRCIFPLNFAVLLRFKTPEFKSLRNCLWLFTLDEDMGIVMLNLLVDLDLALALRIVASPTTVPKYDIVVVLLSNLK